MNLQEIPVSSILVDHSGNCREDGSVSAFTTGSLKQSLKRHGLLNPITVRKASKDEVGYDYKLVSGHRRITAIQELGWETVPANVINVESDVQEGYLNLIENIEREDLHIVDEALALRRLFARGATLSDAARELNQTVSWVKLRFDMLECLTEAQLDALRERGDKIKQTTIRQLVRIKDPEERISKLRDVLEIIDRGGSAKSLRLLKVKPKMSDKRARQASEIQKMNDLIIETLGTSITTRSLAWAAGNITDGDLLNDIAKTCAKFNIHFQIPEEYQ